jgi:membrane-associated progesterone receptor component
VGVKLRDSDVQPPILRLVPQPAKVQLTRVEWLFRLSNLSIKRESDTRTMEGSLTIRARKPAKSEPDSQEDAPRPEPAPKGSGVVASVVLLGASAADALCRPPLNALAVVGLTGLVLALSWDGGGVQCPVWLKRLWPGPATSRGEASSVRWYTREELSGFDGQDPSKPLLLSMGGEVFDVSHESRFYGPSAPYAVFAAKDSTRALTLGSLERKDYEGPSSLDLSDFQAKDWARVREQLQFYREKYPLVGGLTDGVRIPVSEAEEAGGVCLQVARFRAGLGDIVR